MKRIILALALFLLPSVAFAQCNGIFPNNTACGNISGSSNTGRPIPLSSFPANAPGGTTGQIQYNAGSGTFGGFTAGQDCSVNTSTGAVNCTKLQNVPVTTTSAATNDVLAYNGTGFVHSAFASVLNSICTLSPSTCTYLFGYAYAPWWGVKCDGTTDDGPDFNLAFAAINGAVLWVPAGTCHIATKIVDNSISAPGPLTVPGLRMRGAGRMVTKIDDAVPNDYMIAVNQVWASVHHSLYVLTPSSSGGSLATNSTYYISVTATNGSTEYFVTLPKTVSVTGPTGSVQLTLQPIQTGWTYNVYIDTVSPPAHYATINSGNATGLGAGTYTITAIGGAHAIPTTPEAIWQESSFEDLSFTNSANTTGASALLWFKVGYSWMRNVYISGFTGDGVDMPNWTGDLDGWFDVTFENTKWDGIAGWCYNGAGNTLENSNLTIRNSFFNLCGTSPSQWFNFASISGITNANPGVVTTTAPVVWTAGDFLYIQNVAGMSLPNGVYRACSPTSSTTFALCDLNSNPINTTSSGTYTGSGLVEMTFRPPQLQANGNGPTQSGAIAYTGLISNFINNGFTQNKNVDFYFSEAGANDNITMANNDMENTYGVGVYDADNINLSWLNGECLTTNSVGPTTYCMIFGTGLNKGGAINVTIDGIKIRSDVGIASIGFAQLLGAGAQQYSQTFSVRNTYWQTFTGNAKFTGFGGNPFPFFWVRLDGKTGSTCTIQAGLNISSCTRNSTGNYTITFATQPLTGNYSVSGVGLNSGVGPGIIGTPSIAGLGTTSATITCLNSSFAVQDCDAISVQGFTTPN